MTEDLLIRKREEMFSKLDSNSDGVIDEADIQAHITGFLTNFGVSANSPQARELLESGHQILNELGEVGADGKRKITKEQFVESINDNLVERTYVAMNGVFFSAIDADGDGRITESELVDALTRDGMSAGDVRNAFQKLDEDGDGGIVREEWDRATRQMLLNTDPQAPGSLLLGVR